MIEEFGVLPRLRTVDDPEPAADGVVIAVEATGVCRSDWHTLAGHDPDVTLPHVAGHELAGTISALGADVRGWRVGERVTVPFVCACGRCAQCVSGNQQVCDDQFQPGATHWGSFADLVAIERAETNLVRLPDSLDSATAAALGCRFATAYHALVDQGGVRPGQWVVVHGCGGAGASAVLIAAACGARVLAVDVAPHALELAIELGAARTLHPGEHDDPAAVIRELTGGGAHLSLDCAGLPASAAASVACLRTRGTHVQVGLLPPGHGVPPIPMHRVIAGEQRILGSHGMQAHRYPEMLRFVEQHELRLERLIGRRIGLAEVPAALRAMDDPVASERGVTVATLR